MKERFVRYAEQGADFYIADLRWENGGFIAPHTHDFYEIFFVMQGEFSENANGKTVSVRRRGVHIMSPMDSHGLFYPTGRGKVCALRNMVVKTARFEQTVARLGLSPAEVCGHHFLDENVFLTCLKKTELLFGPHPRGAVFDFLMQNVLDDLLAAVAFQSNVDEHAPLWLREVCEAMGEEDNLSLGLPRLRELADRSPEHINRTFQQYFHTTPTEYITTLRLQRAARQLQMTDERILDIAFGCGFNNISYFNRCFKKHYGTTPQQYRDNRKTLFLSK